MKQAVAEGSEEGTVGAALKQAVARLAAAGVEQPRLDARLLLAAALEVEVAQVIGWPERTIDPAAARRFDRSIVRRAAREPVSRILGRREFWGLELAVAPGILDPRPETETLVEAVLARFPDRSSPLDILDLGTGSGCILLALLSEFPQASGLGIDISLEAARVAGRNAERLGLAARCRFMVGNWCESLSGRWKVIVSNPPYIIHSAIPGLAPEVASFDPLLALSGGDDGLEAYRGLTAGLFRHLAPDGLLALELGAGQGDAVEALLSGAGFKVSGRLCDLSGVERCLLAGS